MKKATTRPSTTKPSTTRSATILICILLFASSTFADDRPNILFIITEQNFADVMSCVMGDQYLKTPNLDALAQRGMRFDRAYAANPICVPSRNSIFSGYYPFETGLQSNSKKPLSEAMICMGKHFKDAGYDTGYFGKWHLNIRSKDTARHGFDQMGVLKGNGADHDIPPPATAFLNLKRDKPFLLVTSFTSPHDICQMVRGEKIPGGSVGPFPDPADCPPLPINYAPPIDETDSMTLMRQSYQATKMTPIANFDGDKWRQMRWGYHRLVERADREIGKVLAALKDSGHERNTLVIFTADHGDCTGAHQFAQKTVFYDESARIPFIVAYPGHINAGLSHELVNVGIDTLPTMLEFAGIEIPRQLKGLSLKPVCEESTDVKRRDYIVISNHMVQGAVLKGQKRPPSCRGRMVRTADHKYSVYDLGDHRESFVDMKVDPHEMRNRARDPSYQVLLKKHRDILRKYAAETGDREAIEILLGVR
ncbi:MAG: sulfatase-like hydrolase/transferase [Pirellulaceae bacterium]